MAVVTTSNGNDSVSDRQAQALVTLLENFQPRSALKPYVMHLKAIVKDLELVDQLPDTVPTCSTAASSEFGKCQQNASEEERQPVETGFIDDCGDSDEENDADVIGLMNKLKSSQSFSPQNSIGSTTALHNDGAVYDKTKSFQSGGMSIRTFNMSKLSLSKRPSNDEHVSPTNKPPTPMKSSSMRSPMQQEQKAQSTASRFVEETVEQKAFGTTSILARILEYDGSLVAHYKNYDLIEGYKVAYRRRRANIRFKQREGTNQLAFVNRRFHSLIIGPEGLDEWKRLAQQDIESCKRMAGQLIANSSNGSSGENPSPLAKLFAIVIRNDAAEFERLLKQYVTSVKEGTSIDVENLGNIFGMALKEYVDGESVQNKVENLEISVEGGVESFEITKSEGDRRSMGLAQDHPFLKHVKCWRTKECYNTTLLAELGYNAIMFGAHDVLKIISSKNNTLFSVEFRSKEGQTLLGTVVAHACAQPTCLEHISKGIRILMEKQRYGQGQLHAHQKGIHGNFLHLAAAKGDFDLVDALLDIGFDPTRRCGEQALSNECGEIEEKLWYPEDWARVRGHTPVVKLLSQRRKQIKEQRRQIRRVLSESTNEGTVDYKTADYETLTANDTLTADYGSSSCSSYDSNDFDSEDDTFADVPTFEDNTYADDDAFEYDSDDEPSIPQIVHRL